MARVPAEFEVLGETDDCDIAAMGNPEQGVYGLQFHPEVLHTPGGTEILGNFLRNACDCSMDWHPSDRVDRVVADIAAEAAGMASRRHWKSIKPRWPQGSMASRRN